MPSIKLRAENAKLKYFITWRDTWFGMMVALFYRCDRACLLQGDAMKKGFLKTGLGAMLIASFCTGAMAQISTASVEDKQKKEKVEIVVVEKKDREKPGGGGDSQRPRNDGHRGN